ncbi:hypothetical protein CspeluHIS016_0401010 [Cutaneotrichosporon spelunceum]|uniref:C2H2-type domain-containing protein n=1 Tax=Cutaneotrichosporon spelunceum TaxID=1672016 RepID=A0AAD3TVM7_9TREE|nr:hypothetical protein CspeluHIS016_0401010 [Cutaneotrichosporon spelunceum]
MPPGRPTRSRGYSFDESPEPPSVRSKRSGGPAGRDTPPKKTRTKDLRDAESSAPNRRVTRSTSVSSMVQSPNSPEMQPPKKAVMARRSGGRPMPTPPIANQRTARFEIVPPHHRSDRRSASTEDEEGDELDEEETPPPPSRLRASRLVPRGVEEEDEEGREEGDSEVEVIDMISSDESVGAAGPGPRTSRYRTELQPVPQPSSSVFRKIVEKPPQASHVESIEDPDSSPSSSPRLETQVPRPKRKRGFVGGTELEIFDDDDGDDDDEELGQDPLESDGHHNSDQVYACRWQGCDAMFAISDELIDHMGSHLSHQGAAASARRNSVAVAAAWSSQGAHGARTLDFLTGELERSRSETTDLKLQLAQVKASNDELRDSTNTNEVLRAQALADTQAKYEKKNQAAAEEHENELKARSSELEAMIRTRSLAIEELEAKVKDLESQAKAAADDPGGPTGTAVTLPPDAPPEEQIKERDTIIANLRKDLKRSKKAHKTTKGDLEFFRAQYEVASSSAVQEVNRSKGLEAEAIKLREQLDMGLKQRNLFYKAAVDAANQDAEKARQQVVLLLEQNRRTDDGIRRKAALHHQLSHDKHQLEIDLHKERTRAHELSKRNDELAEMNSQLRGRLMGAFDKLDESDDEGEHEPEPAPFAMPTLVPDDDCGAASVADATIAGEVPAWQCKWQVDDRLCGLYFDSREELDGHGQGVHISALEQG